MSVPPHLLVGPLPLAERPDYVLVIPSFNRPVMLRERTLQILLQQGIDLTRVFVRLRSSRPATSRISSRRAAK